MAVLALPDEAHGGENLPHPCRAGDGKEDGADDDGRLQNQRTPQNVRFKIGNDLSLFCVIVHDVYAADRLVVGNDRHGGIAFERTGVIHAVKHIVSVQRLDDLLQKDQFSRRVLVDGGIVQSPSLAVRDDDSRHVHIAQDRDHLIDRFFCKRIHAAE